jgi:exopolysaccharide biosynthesis WecB/TagA/CpsF family protein
MDGGGVDEADGSRPPSIDRIGTVFVIMAACHSELESTTERPATVIDIDSWRINVATQDDLVARVVADVRGGVAGTVFTINLDHLSKLRRDEAFRAAYGRARHVSADGFPVVLLARAEGVKIDRVTGADLVVPLARAAAEAGIPVYFFGTAPEVLDAAVARLKAMAPGLVVAGSEAPPMGFDPRGDAAAEAARRIVASGAGICLLALGAPKQEVFADFAVETTAKGTWIGVGAALDFIAGHRTRAPRLFQRIGLEWAWRAFQEPRRLLPRYAENVGWLVSHLGALLLGTRRPPRG